MSTDHRVPSTGSTKDSKRSLATRSAYGPLRSRPMTDVPSGWYDDPEHPEQYRYWDGTNWTEHRSPKKAPPGPSNDSTSMVSEGWNLLVQNWLPILLIGVAFVVVTIAVLVAVILQASSALDPGLLTILERMTEPGFDPANDPGDEAFIESIEFNPNLGFWVTTIVGALVVFIAQGFSLGVAQIHLAAASINRPLTLGESFRIALQRLPRWIAVYLLWALVFAIGFFLVALVFVIAAIVPLLLILAIPGAIVLIVYGYPYFYMATTSLVLGRTTDPPFRTTARLIEAKGWRTVAWPVLLANLVVIGVNIGAGLLGIIPIIGQLIALVAQVLLYALPAALNIPIWRFMGGTIGEDIAGSEITN